MTLGGDRLPHGLRMSADRSASSTARASTIAPTMPANVASALSRLAARVLPGTTRARMSRSERTPSVNARRTAGPWRAASPPTEVTMQPAPGLSR